MNSKQAKQIPINDFMDKIGCKSSKKIKNKLWFLSPLREEKNPSFKIDLNLNTWYDFGEGKGGTLIDLVMELYSESVRQALGRLDLMYNYKKFEPYKQIYKIVPETKEKIYIIKKIQDLQNIALIDYIQLRGINIYLAKKYLQEIYYQENKKIFFSLCFKNDSGGYETRNIYSKRSLLNKDITTLHKKNNAPAFIFEGFMDFLTYLLYFNKQSLQNYGTVIILNSNSMVNKAIEKLKILNPTKLILSLDNDNSGFKAVEQFKENFKIKIINQAQRIYPNNEDLNDFWINKTKEVKNE